MEAEDIIALVAVIASFVTIIVTVITSSRTHRFNYKELFAKTVSESRNEWLKQMRDYISQMLAEASGCANNHGSAHKSKEYYKARNEVMLRLNITEVDHLILKKHIEDLDECNSDSELIVIRDDIIDISNKILKDEWEKVKSEAKGEE